jgi:hypothetical protein
MSEITAVSIGEQLLNKEQLIAKATASLGFEGTTPVLGKYELNNDFLSALRAHGFEYGQRVDVDGIATLAGPQPRKKDVIADSWYWNFKTRNDEQALTLELIPFLSESDRGVIFRPYARGTSISAKDPLVNFKVFEVVAKYDPKAHALVGKVVSGQGKITIYWIDIHLGGIRSLYTLFEEFRGGNKAIGSLSHSPSSPFDPNPRRQYIYAPEDVFLPEPFQPALFQLWEDQLGEFQRSLTR